MCSLSRPSRMRAKQRSALSRILSRKLLVTVGSMKPLTFWDFGKSVKTLRGSGAPVEDEVPEGRQAAEPLLEGRLPNRVQDEVDTAVVGQPQRLIGELLRRVVDDRVGAVRLDERHLGVARYRRKHTRAGRLGQLHGGEPDAAHRRV